MDINKVYWAAETATKLKSILTEKKVNKADTPISLMVENNNKNGEKIPQIYHSITSKNGKFIGCKNNEYISRDLLYGSVFEAFGLLLNQLSKYSK